MTSRRRFISLTALGSCGASTRRVQGQIRNVSPAASANDALATLLSLHDFESAGRGRISHEAYEYVAGGAGDELTLKWNRESLDRIRLWPRTLSERSRVDTRLTLFGQELPFPILLAPTGYHRAVHPDGEVATAQGAGKAGAILVVSTSTTTAIEEIARVATQPLWFQLYIQPDRGFMRDFVQQVEAAGVRALCVTVDMAAPGARNRQQRSGFKLAPGMKTPYLGAGVNWQGRPVTGNAYPVSRKDLEWLRSIVRVPVLLKGILHPQDAEIAVQEGASGMVVSNHGARLLDTVVPTIDALPRVVEQIAGRIPILMDGGIRRGTDVIKALAFGAKAVLIGRPYLYGLGVGGADGVSRVINILRRELEMAMELTGKWTMESIDRSVIWPGPA
jgi:4-hydroxymandelate oxidase